MTPPPKSPPTAWFRVRLSLIFMGFLLVIGLVAFRLVQLQVWINPQLEGLATKQFQQRGKRTANRLPIMDRNGEELAVTVPSGSIFARPRLVTKKRETSKRLAKWLGGDPRQWLERLKSPKPFVWLQRQVASNVAKEITAAEIPGIYVEAENKRIYPNEDLAAATIGYTDIDGNGIAGLEHVLNERLLPANERFSLLRDGKGIPSYLDRGYVAGTSQTEILATTLDRRVQHVVEEELDAALSRTQARGAYAVVMDPETGDVLALAQRPTFDPNRFSQFPQSMHFNQVVAGLFEPGSTLKTIAAAEALELGLLKPETPVDCGNGEITIGNKKIREADAHHKFSMLPLTQVITYSSNVGAIRIAQALGVDRFRFALDKFGLTTKTGILLPGEAAFSARNDSFWTPFSLASASFGQGISMTPLQIVAAFAPFANGGYWVKPRLVPTLEPESRRKVISTVTAEKMKRILLSVTEDERGTGRTARIDGVRVAGKTGTAQKFSEGMGYSAGKYFSSFIGFLPVDRPELLIGVMIDEPKVGYYASELAAPLFKAVAERSLAILNRFPRKEVVKELSLAKSSGPIPAAAPARGIEKNASGLIRMPDLKGLSVAEAVNSLGKNFSSLQVNGHGYLKDQSPAAGTWTSKEAPVELSFAPI